MARVRRYRVSWRGLFDGPRKYPRILIYRGTNKKQVEAVHAASYPFRERKVTLLRKGTT